ncbi:Cyclic nucleotide-binding domain containing protein [Novymonas esmeraldas]|uniref:Cyclic nucleotide-binding domain containing protein n=1 Tax=Novymonas esmeraldas TaxID=1808958 RepID=A0AAW0ENN8_9TRYP
MDATRTRRCPRRRMCVRRCAPPHSPGRGTSSTLRRGTLVHRTFLRIPTALHCRAESASVGPTSPVLHLSLSLSRTRISVLRCTSLPPLRLSLPLSSPSHTLVRFARRQERRGIRHTRHPPPRAPSPTTTSTSPSVAQRQHTHTHTHTPSVSEREGGVSLYPTPPPLLLALSISLAYCGRGTRGGRRGTMSRAVSPSEAKSSAGALQQRTLSMSASERVRKLSRRESALPHCMSRAQQEARRQSASLVVSGRRRQHRPSHPSGSTAVVSLVAASTANGWGPLLSCAETNAEVSRAIQMCSFYPSMRVTGTAFENSLNLAHRQSMHVSAGAGLPYHARIEGTAGGSIVAGPPDDTAHSPTMSISVVPESCVTLREAMEESRSVLDLSHGSGLLAASGGGGGGGRNSITAAGDTAARALAFTGGATMVQVACAMKRAAMWQVVIVTALAHSAMESNFRRERLRRVLERHMLPTLVRRKKVTGSVVSKRRRSKSVVNAEDDGGNASRGPPMDETTSAPQGTYLRDHDAFFDALHNAALLQSFAETMTRHRFVPGDVIARAGDSSQKAMYFLISGKCEVCTERGRQGSDGGAADLADEETAAAAAAHGYARQHQRKSGGAATSRPVKEVIMPGTSFGGVFGGSALFAGTYRALSQCIVWVLRAEEFEQLFRPFADRMMLDKYKEAVRQHSLWWLQQRYQPAKCYASIPIYRKLTKRMSTYMDDFTPVVKVRGETLFAQGDAAGDVYCMLEGTVLRRTRGAAGTYGDDGVAQRLGTNSFSALNVAGRHLMLGEEPHLVPGLQPYTCTVSSRVALFFKIPGDRFVNALLDDPSVYAQLRERLMQQRQHHMRLHPECLAYVPLLQRFPAEKREELVQYAQPRVLGRSVSVCDPAQHLSDLFIIVSGGVRDPRHYSHKAVKPLAVPASCETENPDGTAEEEGGGGRGLGGGGGANAHGRGGGKADRRHHGGAGPQPSHGDGGPAQHSGAAIAAAAAAAQRSHSATRDTGAGGALRGGSTLAHPSTAGGAAEAVEQDAAEWNFSFRDVPFTSPFTGTATSLLNTMEVRPTGTGGGGGGGGTAATSAQQLQQQLDSAPLVYPDESEDINPALPVQPARRFACALAGSWEALLLDKWPNGWESMTTVEVWAIPTRMLRLVYNSCPKPVQLSILNGLRCAQKEEQQLPTVPHTKLPPMSAYAPNGDAAVVAAAVAAAKDSTMESTKGVARRGGGRRPAPPPSRRTAPAAAGGDDGGVTEAGTQCTASSSRGARAPAAAAAAQGARPAAKLSSAGSPERPRLAVPLALPDGAHGGAAAASARQKTAPASRSAVGAPPDAAAHGTGAHTTSTQLRAQEGRERSLRRLREATAARDVAKATPDEPKVSPALLASYGGVLGAADPLMLRIVRDPAAVAPPRRQRDAGLAATSTPTSQRLPPLLSTSECAPAAAWPSLTPAQDRWFQAVPSYEPLPGTARAAQTLATPPVFAPSSTVLASAGISSIRKHGKALEGHVAYYAAGVSPTRAASRATLGGTSLADAAVVVATPAASPWRSPSQTELGVSRSPLPKRRAYVT